GRRAPGARALAAGRPRPSPLASHAGFPGRWRLSAGPDGRPLPWRSNATDAGAHRPRPFSRHRPRAWGEATAWRSLAPIDFASRRPALPGLGVRAIARARGRQRHGRDVLAEALGHSEPALHLDDAAVELCPYDPHHA